MRDFNRQPHKTLIAAVILLVIAFSLPVHAVEKTLTVEDIVKENARSIVLIGAINPKGASFGSGFIVSSSGLVVTNFHVVKNAIKIEVKFKDSHSHEDAVLVSSDAKKDIAILRINKPGLKPVLLGDSDRVQVGEKVVAIGNPLGLENTVSDGLISSIRDAGRNSKVLQITAPVSAGSSGCPLFNLKGEVIGIAVGSNLQGQNINFAIPIDYAKKILPSERLAQAPIAKKNSLRQAETMLYIVKPRDTLFDLARKFDTTVEALMEINHLSNTTIFVDQRLRVPQVR